MTRGAVVLEAETIHLSSLSTEPCQALLVRDGGVVAAGSRDDIGRIAPAGAHYASFPGATVVSGLVESHVHTVFSGLIHQWADLRPDAVSTVPELIAATRDFGLVDGWFRGWGYDDTLLAEQRHPDRFDLDEVSTEQPVLVTHVSGHFAVCNSRALQIAGVSAETPDPDGGRFVRDEHGSPTGLLWEVGAVRAVRDRVPTPSAADGRKAAQHTMREAARRGITQIHDLGIGSQLAGTELDILKDLAATGDMPIRTFGYLRGDLAAEAVAADPEIFRRDPVGNFKVQGVKFWADGSIQGLSASVSEPYHCCPDSHGDLLLNAADIRNRARDFVPAGAQIAVHANGDRAIAEVIEAYRELPGFVSATGSGPGHRIEHFQMADPEHISACAALGIGVSIFLNHVHYWGDRHRDRFLGPRRAHRMDALRECLDSGVRVGVHSDSPITPMDVLATLDTAVGRRTSSGAILGADQAVTAREALHVATAASAELIGVGDRIGRLEPGFAADLTVLDADPLDPARGEEPFATGVQATMVGGRWVHEG